MTAQNENSSTKKSNIEPITPHKLTVAILIRDYCHFRDSDKFNCGDDGILKAQYRRDFCVLILKLLQSPDLSLAELSSILVSKKYTVHPTVIETFNETLLNLYSKNGAGTLLDIIDSLNRIMMTFNESIGPGLEQSCFVSKSSLVGYYLRRLIVNFDKLTYSEVTAVFLNFRKYYEDWQKTSNMQNQIVVEVKRISCSEDWYV